MRASILLSLVLALGGCAKHLVIGELSDDGDAATGQDAGDDASTGEGDADVPDEAGPDGQMPGMDAQADSGPPSGFDCDARGPLFDVGDGPAPGCPGPDAPLAFRHAICSCDDVVVNDGTLFTDGFLGAATVGSTVGGAGSVAASATFFSSLPVDFGGSLTVNGDLAVNIDAPLNVGGDLRSNGRLTGTGSVSVAGAARVDGSVELAAFSAADGLTVQTGSTVSVAVGPSPVVAEEDIDQDYAPCDCDAPLDLAARLQDAASNNDNASVGLAPKGLNTTDSPLEMRLSCGVYFVEEISARAPLTLTIDGRVALYVERVLTTEAGGVVSIQLGPDAELDLIIGGDMSINADLDIGSATTAGRVRLYVDGGNIFIAGKTAVGGPIYAPKSTLSTIDELEIHGAAFVGRWVSAARAEVHHDLSLARADCGQQTCADDAECGANDRRCVASLCLP